MVQNIRIIGEPGVRYAGPPIRFVGKSNAAIDIMWTDQWDEPADMGDDGIINATLIEPVEEKA